MRTPPSVRPASAPNTRLIYIDALRGYAICGVIIAHCIFLYSDLPSWLAHSAFAYGGRGVQLFFVVSALTLAVSWLRQGDGATPFYLRRFFRIAPMWWLAVGYWLATMGTSPRYFAPNGVSTTDVLLNIALLHGITPTAIDGIVPGGWSIALEVMFYAIFPVLIALCSTLGRSLVILLIFTALRIPLNAFIATLTFPSDGVRIAFTEFFFGNQLPVFLLGICIYHVINRWPLSVRLATLITIVGCLTAFLLPYDSIVGPTPLAYAYCWVAITYGLANGGARILVNRAIAFVGTISYSAYFWHFIVLNNPIDLPKMTGGLSSLTVLVATTFALTIPLSWLTYICIEKPLIRLGACVVNALKGPQAAGLSDLTSSPQISTSNGAQ